MGSMNRFFRACPIDAIPGRHLDGGVVRDRQFNRWRSASFRPKANPQPRQTCACLSAMSRTGSGVGPATEVNSKAPQNAALHP